MYQRLLKVQHYVKSSNLQLKHKHKQKKRRRTLNCHSITEIFNSNLGVGNFFVSRRALSVSLDFYDPWRGNAITVSPAHFHQGFFFWFSLHLILSIEALRQGGQSVNLKLFSNRSRILAAYITYRIYRKYRKIMFDIRNHRDNIVRI